MSDPFSQKNASDRAREERTKRAAEDKTHVDAITDLVKRRAAQAKRSPNDDIGYRMRPKFFEPGGVS